MITIYYIVYILIFFIKLKNISPPEIFNNPSGNSIVTNDLWSSNAFVIISVGPTGITTFAVPCTQEITAFL